VGAGQSVLASQQHQLVIPVAGGAAGQSLLASPVKLLPTSPLKLPPSPLKPAATTAGVKPRKTGSVGLFFRKFYHIAYLRLENLCNSMQVSQTVFSKEKKKNCFEVKEKIYKH
jgi:hypothetical protein